jgi:hypothetical protein
VPVLLHEMIHLQHLHHGKAFKREAQRVGALLHARPLSAATQLPWRWIARCPRCERQLLYRTRRKLFCRHCRDWLGRYPALEFSRLPGDVHSPADAKRMIAALQARQQQIPERKRPRRSPVRTSAHEP